MDRKYLFRFKITYHSLVTSHMNICSDVPILQYSNIVYHVFTYYRKAMHEYLSKRYMWIFHIVEIRPFLSKYEGIKDQRNFLQNELTYYAY